MFTLLPIECRYDLICIFTYFRPQRNFLPPKGPPRAPWGPLRAPEASKTCLSYSPLNVDMIWYAFLHTLDHNKNFYPLRAPWGPPEGPLRAPEGSWGLENVFTVLPIECRYDLICIFTYFRPQRSFYPLRAPSGPPEGPLRAQTSFFFAETWFLSHFILHWIKKKHIQSHLK